MKLTKKHAMKVLEVVDAGLSNGLGNPIPGQMCVEAAVCYALGLPHGDDPQCVGDAVRTAKIALNDCAWSSPAARAKGLRRVAIAQLGSDSLDQTEFVTRLAKETIRTMVPIALRAAASMRGCPATHKEALEAAAVACEKSPTEDAASAASAAGYAASDAAGYAASAAGYAASDAARCAASDAASAASDAAGYAASAAGYAARCAASAAGYAARCAASDQVLSEMAEIMVQILISMKSPGCKWLSLTEDR